MRIIHTNLFSDVAENVMKSVLIEIKNGRYGKTYRTVMTTKIVRDVNNEIVLNIDDNDYHYRNSIYRKFDYDNKMPFNEAVLDMIANWIKTTVFNKGFKSNWRRASELAVKFSYGNYSNSTFEVNVNAIYCIYEVLKGRKNIDRKYSKDLINQTVGEVYDPIRTEQNRIMLDELTKLKDNLDKKISDLRNSRDNEMHNVRVEIERKYTKLIDEVNELYKTKVNEVKQTFGMLLAVA